MERLLEVVKLVADKYIENSDVIVDKDLLTIEYHTYTVGDRDVFKTIQVTEFEDKLKVNFISEKVTKIIELNELNNIFNILKHQEQYRKPSENELAQIIKQYPSGTKIRLEKIYDLVNDIPEGSIGIINDVKENRTLQVEWKNGTVTEVFVGRDKFNKI